MYKFIDLFAGIGGIRIAFERQGGECVFSSEWDPKARETYEANFGYKPVGDICKVPTAEIPDHDILLAGFPCQPFSLAGVSKKNSLGRKHGFADETQGTLFFEIARILRDKKPKAFLLENVKNLRSHDNSRTFRTIMRVLQKELGYKVYDTVLDAKGLVPQHRERIYLVGFKQPLHFEFPSLPENGPPISSILESNVDGKYTLTDNLWKYLQVYAEKHKKAGNGFGFGLVDFNGPSRTLSARYYKDGSEILIPQEGKNPRRLTPQECAKLQGFRDDFKIVVSDAAAYKQFGNSVAVPVVEKIAERMFKALKQNKKIIGGYDRSKYHYSNIRDEAIARASQYGKFFCKFISGTDIGKTGTHQSGIYVPENAWSIVFDKKGTKEVNQERPIRVYWEQLDFHTDSMAKWYGKKSRSEYRITRFGKNFPFFTDDYLGDLLIIIKVNSDEYLGYVLSGDDSESFLETFSISPTDNTATYGVSDEITSVDLTKLEDQINNFVASITAMPTPRQISNKTRAILKTAHLDSLSGGADTQLLEWIELEYLLVKALEKKVYRDKLNTPFDDLDSLLEFADTAAQTRSRRSELSLQFHLDYIFKKLNFVYNFPEKFSLTQSKFIFEVNTGKAQLISNMSCKDNWKDHIQTDGSSLFMITLEKGISTAVLDEMSSNNITLVVPSKYHSFYPTDYQLRLLSLTDFCNFITERTSVLSTT